MAIKSGRVGVATDQVDAYGRVVASDFLVDQLKEVLPQTELVPLSVNVNGVYSPDEGKGFGTVTVNVPTAYPSVTAKDINFYDYDGTCLYSYTKTEWANVTELPSNPSHDGLIAQGWNYTKSDIDSYVTTMIVPLDVGQSYKTVSGATEVDIELFDPFLSPQIRIAPNGTSVIDWGDGHTDTVVGTNSTTSSGIKTTSHTYSSAGKYTIKISISSGKLSLFGYSTSNSQFLMGSGGSSYSNMDKTYQSTVKHIRLGDGDLTVYGPIFACMSSLETITIPKSETLAFSGGYNFVYCVSLKAIVVPKGITLSGNQEAGTCSSLRVISGEYTAWDNQFANCFALKYIRFEKTREIIYSGVCSGCWSLQKVVIPSAVTSVKSNTFNNCRSLREVHILAGYIDENQQVVIPTLENTNAFASNQSSRKFYVPRSENQVILNAYKNASNWSSFASVIEEEPA